MAANVFQNVDWLGPEMLRILVNSLQTSQFFDTSYSKEYKKPFAVGETIRISKPQRWLITDGISYAPQPIDNRVTTVTMDQIFGIHFDYNGIEAALKMGRTQDEIKKKFLMPAMKQMANEVDQRCVSYATMHTNNTVGTIGTTPTTLDPYADARTRLKENAVTPGELGMIVTPAMQQAAVKTGLAIFNPTSEISKQYKEGSVGKFAGFDWYEENNLISLTAGVRAAPITVNGAGQSGSSISFNCSNGDTFKAGETIKIAAVNNVNPVNRFSTLSLKDILITQDATASGVTVTLQISPPIEGPGSQYQNVDALPLDTAAVTTWANSLSGRFGLALNSDAYALVGVDMELPKAVEDSFQFRDPDTGLGFMYVKQYDNVLFRMTNRIQMLCGFGELYPDNCAVRVASLK